MPVTELACLHLKNNLPLSSPSNASLNTNLRAGIQAQATYTKARTSILSQTEDPSYIYILGKWDSVAQHMDEWIPSRTNQDILSSLGDGVELVWIQHVDFDPSTSTPGEGIPYSATVMAIGRFFVSPENKDGLGATLAETKHHVQTFKGGRDGAGGWRVDTESGQDEFVLFSGWESVEEHASFAESEGFFDGAEVKHARWEFTADFD
ncbi:hypothetical protein BDW62DRAFT_204379 [Aspergillus aurantiobrunneus]